MDGGADMHFDVAGHDYAHMKTSLSASGPSASQLRKRDAPHEAFSGSQHKVGCPKTRRLVHKVLEVLRGEWQLLSTTNLGVPPRTQVRAADGPHCCAYGILLRIMDGGLFARPSATSLHA
jgi:hypothetical protein